MKSFLKKELSGWSIAEVIWLIFVCMVICGLSVYWRDSIWGIISAVTGILYVVLCGKGRLSEYIFGIVNCTVYSVISFNARLYGETILNVFYYIPMMFVGFFAWKRNIDDETREIRKRQMRLRGRLGLVGVIIAATILFGLVLKSLGDAMPFVDSFTTVSSVIAMIISVKRYYEQWWIWLGVNFFSVYMWWCDFNTGSDNMATLLMWLVYLINGLFILVKWKKDLQRQ